MNDIEIFLRTLQLGPRYYGFRQAVLALTISIEDQNTLTSVIKEIYMVVAEQTDTTWYAVERNIRTLIAQIWSNDKSKEKFSRLSHCSDKPSVSEFLDVSSYYLAQKRREKH